VRLDTDVETDTQFSPFRRLRTPAELELGVSPYPPSGYNVPTKLDTQAVVLVRQGTPNAVPVAPAAGAGEVALYQVRVEAGATVLTPDKVTDVRPLLRSLVQALALIDALAPFEATLDAATSLDVPNTLAKRDGSGNTRINEIKVDSMVRYMADNTIRRSAFVREDCYDLIDVETPTHVPFTSVGPYSNVKRAAINSQDNPGYSPPIASVPIAPDFDCYLDPADFMNVPCKFEVYGLAANGYGSGNVQLWNATDSVELANTFWTWLDPVGGNPPKQRSALFNLTGTGLKRLVVRVKFTDVADLYIWRARLVFNPAF
jgi:hypothetical protein